MGENPYNYNLPVTPEMFFGRERDRRSLTAQLLAPQGDSVALIGGRRIGKTSLLEALQRDLGAPRPEASLLVVPLLLDLSGEGLDSVASFFRSVASSAAAALAEHLPSLPPGELPEGAPAPGLRTLLERWNRLVMSESGRRLRLVLLLDECEEIVDTEWAPALHAGVRALLVGQTTRTLLKVVMAGSHRFLAQVRHTGSPLWNVLVYHTLAALPATDARELVLVPTRGAVRPQTADAVYAQAGGHPFLTQYLMHHLWERGVAEATLDEVSAIAAAFPASRHDFEDWARALGAEGMRAYRLLMASPEPMSLDVVSERMRPSLADPAVALSAICYHGLVVQGPDGSYSSGAMMFQRWASAQVTDDRARAAPSIDRTQLRTLLTERFSDEELSTLCFDLGVDIEHIPGAAKEARARELVRYFERRNDLAALVAAVRTARPNAFDPQ